MLNVIPLHVKVSDVGGRGTALLTLDPATEMRV
jgi:hypothetical protein